ESRQHVATIRSRKSPTARVRSAESSRSRSGRKVDSRTAAAVNRRHIHCASCVEEEPAHVLADSSAAVDVVGDLDRQNATRIAQGSACANCLTIARNAAKRKRYA